MVRKTTVLVILFAVGLVSNVDAAISDKWTIAKAGSHGLIVLFRLREELPDVQFRTKYPHLVSVVWKYQSSGSGLPSSDTDAKMSEFEDKLNPIEDQMIGYMVIVITGKNQKEWIWYTSDKQKFIQQFNKSLGVHNAYPVQVEFSDDPDWQTHAQLLNSIRKQ